MNYDSTSAATTGLLLGQRTLQISLFGDQAQPLKPLVGKGIGGETKVGDFVRVDNLRVKRNDSGLLEGTVIDDDKYKDKRYVRLIGKQESLKVPEIARLLQCVTKLLSSFDQSILMWVNCAYRRKKEQGRWTLEIKWWNCELVFEYSNQ